MENNMFKISGNMVRECVLNGKGDKACCFFTVAVNRSNGGADFIPVKAFRSLAESIAKTLGKGDSVEIEGRISTSSYEKDGKKIYTTDLIADKVCKLQRTVSSESTRVVEVKD